MSEHERSALDTQVYCNHGRNDCNIAHHIVKYCITTLVDQCTHQYDNNRAGL